MNQPVFKLIKRPNGKYWVVGYPPGWADYGDGKPRRTGPYDHRYEADEALRGAARFFRDHPETLEEPDDEDDDFTKYDEKEEPDYQDEDDFTKEEEE